MAGAHIRHRVDALTFDRGEPAARDAVRLGPPHRHIATILIAVVAAAAVGPFMAAALVGLVVLVRRCRPLIRVRREAAQVAEVLPDVLELFVLMVHAGLTPRHGIELLAARAPVPVRHGFGAVIDRVDRGEPLADALRALPDLLGPSALSLSDLVGSADRYGLPLGPVLAQLAEQARADRRRADDANARALPVKLAFPLVVCTLPSFVLLAIIPAVMAALSSLQGTSW